MGWANAAPGYARREGTYGECLGAAFSADGDRIDWAATGGATRIHYTNPGGDLGPFAELRPPAGALAFAEEQCTGFSYTFPNSPPFTGSFTRTASTKTALSSGGVEWPKPKRAVLLSVEAIDKSSGASLDALGHGYGIGEPDNRWSGAPIDPATTHVTVDFVKVYANGQVFLNPPRSTTTDITPRIASVSWFQWAFTKVPHTISRLTWSYHALVGAPPNVQSLFDEGSRLLAQDTDSPDQYLRDDQVQTGSEIFLHDDVPCAVEFICIQGKNPTFPTIHGSGNIDFSLPAYLDVVTDDDVERLITARFANLKIVKSIKYGGSTYAGLTIGPALPSAVYAKQYFDKVVAIHEYGHMAGLDHRGDTQYPNNPGPDPRAIMDINYGPHGEVNRTECSAFQNFQPAFWND
jgi:hypothetical protein